MNALVANAKSPPALSVIRSLGSKNIEVTGASDLKNDFPLHSKYCKNRIFLHSRPEETDNRIDELFQIVKQNHFDVFLPIMSEKLLLALLQHKEEFEKYTKLPFTNYEKFRFLNNKVEVSRMLADNKLPGPKTWMIDDGSNLDIIKNEAAFPLIIKPVSDEGAKGVQFIAGTSDLETYYYSHPKIYGTCLIQEFIKGPKYAAIFLVNVNSEPRRLFVHRAIREYPVSGGPTCFLESVKYDPILEIGMKLLQKVNFYGIVEMEFVIDENDGNPKIIDVNPRFYACLQCAIAAGVDFPYALYCMAVDGDIKPDFSYREGVTSRHLLFEDTKHLIDIMRGVKSPKYSLGKIATLVNYLKFHRDDSYFILSASDPMPAIRKILNQF